LLWQRIRKPECNEVAGALTLYMREISARVDSRTERVVYLFWLDPGGAQFKPNPFYAGVSLCWKHGLNIESPSQCATSFWNQRAPVFRRAAECNSRIQPSATMRCERATGAHGRSAELHSAVSQIFN